MGDRVVVELDPSVSEESVLLDESSTGIGVVDEVALSLSLPLELTASAEDPLTLTVGDDS